MSHRPLLLHELVGANALLLADALELMPVIVDDVVEYFLPRPIEELMRLVDGQVIRPPYAKTWLEIRVPVEGGGHDLLGCYCKALRTDDPYGEYLSHLQRLPHATWEAPPLATAPHGVLLAIHWSSRHMARDGSLHASYFIPCDLEWRALPEVIVRCIGASVSQGDKDGLLTDLGYFCAATLALFHVKNATTPVVSNRAERRQAAKAGRPHVAVRELVIEPMRYALHAMREAQRLRPGEPMPYHLCRGHFKSFTAQAPMLGQHVGTYWWEPHWRGHRDVGTVRHPRVQMKIAEATV